MSDCESKIAAFVDKKMNHFISDLLNSTRTPNGDCVFIRTVQNEILCKYCNYILPHLFLFWRHLQSQSHQEHVDESSVQEHLSKAKKQKLIEKTVNPSKTEQNLIEKNVEALQLDDESVFDEDFALFQSEISKLNTSPSESFEVEDSSNDFSDYEEYAKDASESSNIRLFSDKVEQLKQNALKEQILLQSNHKPSQKMPIENESDQDIDDWRKG